MSLYDIKIKRLALLLLPTSYRKPLMAAFAQHLVQGVNVVCGDFMRWRQDRHYRLTHNGQVCYLRAALNDAFDQVERRITVEDEQSSEEHDSRLYLREMERPILLPLRGSGEAYIINRRGYGGVSGYDFWVSIPYALRGKVDETRLARVVDTYRLASKRWTINYK